MNENLFEWNEINDALMAQGMSTKRIGDILLTLKKVRRSRE